MTMLHGFEGTRRVIGSGFGGPALYPGQLIHDWRGRTDQWPYFVMARADPTVDRIVAVTDRGTEVELSLSAVVHQFGLRFAAAGPPPESHPTGSSLRSTDSRPLTCTGRCTERSLIDPVDPSEWNSDARCVLLDLSAFPAIAAHISKHAISEDGGPHFRWGLWPAGMLVGVTGFEPAASSSRTTGRGVAKGR